MDYRWTAQSRQIAGAGVTVPTERRFIAFLLCEDESGDDELSLSQIAEVDTPGASHNVEDLAFATPAPSGDVVRRDSVGRGCLWRGWRKCQAGTVRTDPAASSTAAATATSASAAV